MIDLRRLRLLRELEMRGTITAAAHSLSFTPSAVSQQLARLEQETGVALLEKVGRGVKLTDAGRILAAHAERILDSVEAAEADLAAQAGVVRGQLRVGTFQSAGLALLTPALELLALDHPALEIDVVEADPEQTLPALLLGGFDLVFVDEYKPTVPRQNLDRVHLLDDGLRIVLPRNDALAAASEVRLADLATRRWATGQVGSSYAEEVERTCSELGGFLPRIGHRASDLLLLLGLIGAGNAVALLPDILGAERDSRVAVRPIAGHTLTRKISTLVRATSARRPTIIALREALAQVASTKHSPPAPLLQSRRGDVELGRVSTS
jgi:DNA-binding transcriptional LysR family regulator